MLGRTKRQKLLKFWAEMKMPNSGVYPDFGMIDFQAYRFRMIAKLT